MTARRALQLALRVSNDKTSKDDLNSARYYLCYLDWDAGNLYEAAVLGEFLARNYPDSMPGRQGARIALAAAVRLYAEAQAGRQELRGGENGAAWPGNVQASPARKRLTTRPCNCSASPRTRASGTRLRNT